MLPSGAANGDLHKIKSKFKKITSSHVNFDHLQETILISGGII